MISKKRAYRFKMLLASGSLIGIPLDRLLSGRLKKHRVEYKKKQGYPRISGIDGDLTPCKGPGRICKEFSRSDDAFPYSALAAIEKEFNVEIVDEYDPRFWGFTSQEELDAHARKMGARQKLLDAAYEASTKKDDRLKRSAVSSRVRRTHDISEERIRHEHLKNWLYLLQLPYTE
jgi:hypothetical protein